MNTPKMKVFKKIGEMQLKKMILIVIIRKPKQIMFQMMKIPFKVLHKGLRMKLSKRYNQLNLLEEGVKTKKNV